ncbi:MAG TPA: ABC transporter substrate-binding protein [Synergistaceae bacterium]|nr:ABC transporter substrate-binding protein [Synergistaceae bacterium]HPQ36293.1 ABC transporter substrate-binding protein [Synergistaceae bacterium]
MKRRLLCSLLMAGWLFLLPWIAGGAEKVVFVDNSWDSIQVLNRIAGFVLQEGYGFDTEYLFAETLPGLMGVERGEAQVIMEVWVDNYGDWYAKAQERKKIVPLGENYPGAPQGWYVPTYVIKGDPQRGIEPMAPDLEYIQDLPKYWELFKSPEEPKKGRFYNGPTGWVISTITETKFKTTGLDEYFEVFFPGSDMALSTAASTAYKRGLPVLIYYWEPSWLLGLYDMTLLKDKIPYSEERWVEGDYGCDYPRSRVWKMANAAFLEAHPEVRAFLERFETTLGQNNKALAYMKANEEDPAGAALWFLKEYPENWKAWIGDEEKSAKVAKALEKK